MVRFGKEHVDEILENFPGIWKYIHNDIVKHFRVGILHYNEHVRDMYLSPPLNKGREYNQADLTIRGKKYLSMRFVMRLRTDFLHTFRMN